MRAFKIVQTDSYDRDYPNEHFLNLPSMRKEEAEDIADVINKIKPAGEDRYYKVVPEDYKLEPGFEP